MEPSTKQRVRTCLVCKAEHSRPQSVFCSETCKEDFRVSQLARIHTAQKAQGIFETIMTMQTPD
jgi:predicted nucleic acid-binding Zn ribbon protein